MTPSTPSTTLVTEQRRQPRNAAQLIGDLSYGVVYAGQGWAGLALMVNVMKLVAGPQDFATILRMTHVTDGDAFVHASMALALGVGLVLGVLRPFIGEAWAMVLVGWVITAPLAIGGAWVNGGLSATSPAWAWMLVLVTAGVFGGGMGFALGKEEIILVRRAAVARLIDETELPVNATTVLRELREAFFPVLRAHGFTVFGERGAWRYREGRIEVVCFQLPDGDPEGAADVGWFQVMLALYLTCVPVDDYQIDRLEDQLTPNPDQCHLCCNLGDSWMLSGHGRTSLKRAVAAASGMLSWRTWFARFADDRRVLEVLPRQELFAWDGTRLAQEGQGLRDRVMGYLHLKLGNRREALQHLKALQQEMNYWGRWLAAEYNAEGFPKMERLARDVAFLELDV